MHLNQIIGQDKLKRQLGHLLQSGQTGHAYVFSGPAGTGRRTLAETFAAHLMCMSDPVAPCGICAGCRMAAAGTHPDMHRVEPDPEKDRIVIEQIRQLMSQLSIRSVHGRKVLFVFEADKMNEAAQNCLLKSLEEPPPETLLLMTAVRFDKLLPTVQSRSIRLELARYDEEDVRRILAAQGMDPTGKPFCLAYADGIPGRAARLLTSATLGETREKALAVLPGAGGVTAADALLALLSEDRNRFPEAVDVLMTAWRDIMMMHEGLDKRLINGDKRDMIGEAVRRSRPEEAQRRIMQLDGWRAQLDGNLNYQLAVDGFVAALAD